MKRVFISYSWKDSAIADEVRAAIPEQFEVWIDKEKIGVGDSISTAILEGLTASDYYIILISENSNSSPWVRREIALAFDLANRKNLSVVPVLLSQAEIPLEFKGLLYIDFRKSINDGLKALQKFFTSQETLISHLEPKHKMLKSESDAGRQRLKCNEQLREMSLGDLRYLVADRLAIEDVAVVWFDLFSRRMNDEVQVSSLSLACVELP
jgi:hypothetical protein